MKNNINNEKQHISFACIYLCMAFLINDLTTETKNVYIRLSAKHATIVSLLEITIKDVVADVRRTLLFKQLRTFILNVSTLQQSKPV